MWQILDLIAQFGGCLNERHLLHLVAAATSLSLHLHLRPAWDATLRGSVQLSRRKTHIKFRLHHKCLTHCVPGII